LQNNVQNTFLDEAKRCAPNAAEAADDFTEFEDNTFDKSEISLLRLL